MKKYSRTDSIPRERQSLYELNVPIDKKKDTSPLTDTARADLQQYKINGNIKGETDSRVY